ncbi:hypothetical protein DPX16_22838 [Anabarilius grahami]|uniref:Uncharacterized protein n=1 Tax=Anabarilius grahami TaxID=495550 RepID=A0A3N0Y472_ANAGA|nr:hypothetical protein DPX16_22838 [Anabarilius grahami]
MADYIYYYLRKASDTDSDPDLSNIDRIYVIPNPIHVREERDERDETDSSEDSEYTPPPYELAGFKLNISDVPVTPDSEMEASYVPPPPYSPPLNMPSQSSSPQQ